MGDLRVSLLTPYPPVIDGIAFYSRELSKALSAVGLNVYIATWLSGSNDVELKGNVKIVRIEAPTKFGFFPSAIRELLGLSPDIVHVQYGFRRGVYGRTLGEQLLPILYALHGCNLPVVFTMHDIWNRHDLFARYSKGGFSFPQAVAYHAYLHILCGLMVRYADAIVVHSDFFARVLNQEYHVMSKKLFVIRHGVPEVEAVSSGKARSTIGVDSDVLLYFGVIYAGKGIEHLIYAMRYVLDELPNAHLVIAGSPHPIGGVEYVKKLQGISRSLGLERNVSIFARYVEEDEVPVYFSAASIVIVPNIYDAGVSGVINLAFAFEKPVIASSSPLRIDELGAGENIRGTVAQLRDPRALARAAVDLLKNDRLREKMISNARLYRIENSWRNMAERTSKMYEQTIKQVTA
jgi:glycosyltransferase involved in cell wall biosynthesis